MLQKYKFHKTLFSQLFLFIRFQIHATNNISFSFNSQSDNTDKQKT